ncbi:MAG TPA: hypothetical protein VIM19_17785 [Actinomycetes bacterium]
MATRGVSKWETPDGMSEVCARLAPQDAATVWNTLTTLAHSSAGPDDPRGLDTRRADALVGVFTAIATGTAVPQLPALPALPSGRAGRRVRRRPRWRADVVVAASTLLGWDDAPGRPRLGAGPAHPPAVHLDQPHRSARHPRPHRPTHRPRLGPSAAGIEGVPGGPRRTPY